MNAADGKAGGLATSRRGRRTGPDAGNADGESVAVAMAAEEAARRRGLKRTRFETGAAVLLLLGLLWVDDLSGFLLALPILQLLAWPLYATRKSRPAGPGTPILSATPFGRAWFFGLWVLLLGAVFLESRSARLLVSVVLASTAAAAPAARANVMRVRLVRRLSARTRAGAPTPVTYVLSNGGRRESAGLVVRDPLGLAVRPATLEAAFDAVTGGDRAEVTATVVFERRGWRRLKVATIATRHPLGLFAGAVDTVAPAETLVRPREGRPTAALLARLRGGSTASGRLISAQAGTDHFHGLREFREGDDPRRVHWKTTARRQVTTFVEWREEQARRVVVALSRGEGRGLEHDRRFERAVSIAATVTRAAARAGIPVRLVLGAPDLFEREGDRGFEIRGRRGLESALDALAVVRSGGTRRPESALDRFERDPAGQTLVWVGVGPEPEVARRAELARGRGVGVLHLRADDPRLRRFVGGLP